MTQKFTLLLGGELTVTDRLLRQVAGSRIIAADGGMAHAASLGVTPELWLGDFDSSDDALLTLHRHVPRQTHPADKNATDGELAIEEAVRLGATELLLAGGLGGQMDHAFAHLMQLLKLRARGLTVMSSSGHEEAWPVVDGAVALALEAGTRLSVLPVSDLLGLTIEGVRWPLHERDVVLGSTLTLSNEVSDASAKISVAKGMAIVLVYPA
jgi:thiamine pyrophosphokinase